MNQGEVDWAGVAFLALSPRDAPMMRGPGLFACVRRGLSGRALLFVDHADCISEVAGPGRRPWALALQLGMDEFCVCLSARERLDRLILKAHIVRRLQPPLNLDRAPPGFPVSYSSRYSRVKSSGELD